MLIVVVAIAAIGGVGGRNGEQTLTLRAADGPGSAERAPGGDAAGNGKIINGKPLDDASFQQRWPFLVGLLDTSYGPEPYYQRFCDGTLVAPRIVVTAAHCINGNPADAAYVGRLRVLVGSVKLKPTATQLRVSKITVHPSWTGDVNDDDVFDVAVIELAANAPAPAAPIAVVGPNEDLIWGAGKGVSTAPERGPRVAGWGDVQTGPTQSYPTSAMETDIPIYSDHSCAWDYLGPSGASTGMVICGGIVDIQATTAGTAGTGTCFGDSGGPLVAAANGQWRLVGIVSYGVDDCVLRRFGDFFTRTAALRDWLAPLGVPIGTGSVTAALPPAPMREGDEQGTWDELHAPAAGPDVAGGGGGAAAGSKLELTAPKDNTKITKLDGYTTFSWKLPSGVHANRLHFKRGTATPIDLSVAGGVGYRMPNVNIPFGDYRWCVTTTVDATHAAGETVCRHMLRKAAHRGQVVSVNARGRSWKIRGALFSIAKGSVSVKVRIVKGSTTLAKGATTVKPAARGRYTSFNVRTSGAAVGSATSGRLYGIVTISANGVSTTSRTPLR